jgi:hypothetical protein
VLGAFSELGKPVHHMIGNHWCGQSFDNPIAIVVHECLELTSAIWNRCCSASSLAFTPAVCTTFQGRSSMNSWGLAGQTAAATTLSGDTASLGFLDVPTSHRAQWLAHFWASVQPLAVSSACIVWDAARTHGGGLWSSTAMTSACLGGLPSTRSIRQPRRSWTEKTSMRCVTYLTSCVEQCLQICFGYAVQQITDTQIDRAAHSTHRRRTVLMA